MSFKKQKRLENRRERYLLLTQASGGVVTKLRSEERKEECFRLREQDMHRPEGQREMSMIKGLREEVTKEE